MAQVLFARALSFVLALLLPIGTALAGMLTVRVSQQSGQGVEDADVDVTNLGTSAKTSGKTGKGGQPTGGIGQAGFDLAPGTYKVTVSKDGKSATTYVLVTDQAQTVPFSFDGFPTTGSSFAASQSAVRNVSAAGIRDKHNNDPRGQDEADDELEKFQSVNLQAADIISAIIKTLRDNLPAWVSAKLARREGRGQTTLEAIDGTMSSIDKKIEESTAILDNPQARQFMNSAAVTQLQQEQAANQAALEALRALKALYAARDGHRTTQQAADDARTALASRESAANRNASLYGSGDDDDEGDDDDGEPSCFTAGTQVSMADGGTSNIEHVRVGERVVGCNGAVNTVMGIERPRLGGRLLYAFNGGRPFVTAEHPFLTPDGWKSIDPKATRTENSKLSVASLLPGDRVVMAPARGADTAWSVAVGQPILARYGRAETSSRRIGTITAMRADPEVRVYNLLLDGNHSYVADGYLVHNKEGGVGGDGGKK